ncbi:MULTISPECIES: minor capsid protein [unclassified Archaeoglobus]|jgi:SPP1 gp7 family putative phage head morphogenesis protein|uniref:minor capsid protein n=1 Tax=unclassified Archaeoglobus TaxID=2643606 RepID=UPI0025C25DC9|nr:MULTISPECIES: minor capsid protein [unclassified Archaeoglobus]
MSELKKIQLPQVVYEYLEELVKEGIFSSVEEAINTAIAHMISHASRYGYDSVKKKANKLIEDYTRSVEANKATLERYKEAGVKRYKWLSTDDEATCDKCRELHEKSFKIGDKNAPLPPLHLMCRCTIIPDMDK